MKHSYSTTVADWYNSLDEEGKNVLRTIRTPIAMFKNYVRKLKLNLSALN